MFDDIQASAWGVGGVVAALLAVFVLYKVLKLAFKVVVIVTTMVLLLVGYGVWHWRETGKLPSIVQRDEPRVVIEKKRVFDAKAAEKAEAVKPLGGKPAAPKLKEQVR
jgi:hypothetical protein